MLRLRGDASPRHFRDPGVTQPVLYDAGLLKLRKDGLWSLYSLNQDEAPEYYTELVKAVKKALAGNKEVSQDRERLKMAERIGPACVQKKLSS